MTLGHQHRGALVGLVGLVLIAIAGSVWVTRREDSSAAAAVYVALGPSDAVRVGAGQPPREGWVAVVHAGLGGDAQLVNLGINGATLDDVLQLELPIALDARPSLVTIWPGVNDLRGGVQRDTFAARLETLLAALSDLDGTT